MKLTSDLAARMTDALLLHRGVSSTDQERRENAEVWATYSAALNEVRAVAEVLPDNAGTDFVRLMEVWTEDSVNLTATLLDMAICVMLVKRYRVTNPGEEFPPTGITTKITSEDLRTIAEHFHWERTEEPGSWTLKLQKISEMSSGEG